jgi:hypothetical protein
VSIPTDPFTINNGMAELLLCPNIRAATQHRPARKTINEINARGISVV